MATTISDGTTTLTPDLVLGYASSRPVKSLVHEIIGATSPVITERAAGPRTGTLRLFCATQALALSLETLHVAGGVLILTDEQLPALNMAYYARDAIKVELDEQTRERWIVSTGYQEVV